MKFRKLVNLTRREHETLIGDFDENGINGN
jgi:hypothetical protein